MPFSEEGYSVSLHVGPVVNAKFVPAFYPPFFESASGPESLGQLASSAKGRNETKSDCQRQSLGLI